jgi:hypothetical protein
LHVRSAGLACVLLCACGRLGFDAQTLRSDDAASDGSADQAIDECGTGDQDTVALYTFDGALGTEASGKHSGSTRGNVGAGTSRCGAMAARFDQGYVLVPDHADFDLATGSIEMFARLSTTAVADNQTLIARDASGTTFDGHFLILVTPGAELIARLQVGGTNNFRCAAAFPTAQWVHIGVSFGGLASEGLRMWVDGVEAVMPAATLDGSPIDCTGSPTTGIAGNDNALVIGASNARNLVEGDLDPAITQHLLGGELDQVHIRAAWRDFGR